MSWRCAGGSLWTWRVDDVEEEMHYLSQSLKEKKLVHVFSHPPNLVLEIFTRVVSCMFFEAIISIFANRFMTC